MAGLKTYIFNILVAVDQLVNTFLAGYPDETLSSRAHRAYVGNKPFKFFRYIINGIFWWQSDHCLSAYNYEKRRQDVPPELR